MNPRADGRVLEVIEQFPVRRSPRRKAHRESGSACAVWVHIRADVHARAPRVIDFRDGLRHLRPVRLSRRFQVINLDRHAAAATYLDRLIDGFEQPVCLRAHVRDVDAAVRRHHFSQLDQLARGRVFAGRIDQRRGEAERTVLHGSLHRAAHVVELRGRGLALRHAFSVHPQSCGAGEGPEVGRGAMLLHGLQPVAKAVRSGETAIDLAGVVVRLRGEGFFVGGRIGPALAHDFGGDALGDFADQAAVAGEQRAARLPLDVDEARRDDHAGRIDAQFRGGIAQRSGRGDARDTISANPDVAVEPRVA